jgi:hypothetical protein
MQNRLKLIDCPSHLSFPLLAIVWAFSALLLVGIYALFQSLFRAILLVHAFPRIRSFTGVRNMPLLTLYCTAFRP